MQCGFCNQNDISIHGVLIFYGAYYLNFYDILHVYEQASALKTHNKNVLAQNIKFLCFM